jgi:hypothetical protein
MTGRGDGFCLLKIPPKRDGLIYGFAGRPGYPVRLCAAGMGTDLASLRLRLQVVEDGLRGLRQSLEALERE